MRSTKLPLTALALLLSAPLISAEETDFELPACISACIKNNPLSFDSCSDTATVGASEQACVCGVVQFSAQIDCVEECSLEDIAVYAATVPGWCRFTFASALTDEELAAADEESLSDEDWESLLDGPSVVELNGDLAGGGAGSGTDSESETETGDSNDQSVDDSEEEAQEETTDDSSTEDTTSEDDNTGDSADTDAATSLAVPGFALAGAVLLALLF